jgi:hypothetical protein
MSSDGNGRLSFLLRPQKNAKGKYHMGRSNFKGTLDLNGKVFFAYPQRDGSLLIQVEEYDESTAPLRQRSD